MSGILPLKPPTRIPFDPSVMPHPRGTNFDTSGTPVGILPVNFSTCGKVVDVHYNFNGAAVAQTLFADDLACGMISVENSNAAVNLNLPAATDFQAAMSTCATQPTALCWSNVPAALPGRNVGNETWFLRFIVRNLTASTATLVPSATIPVSAGSSAANRLQLAANTSGIFMIECVRSTTGVVSFSIDRIA